MKALYPSYLAATALLITPLVAQATIFQFNAGLNLANEIPTPIMPQTMPTGVATLFYDDKGTPSLADDRYDFALSAFELSGTAAAFHIHGAATTTETAPVRVALDDPMVFTNFKDGGTLLVGGNDSSSGRHPRNARDRDERRTSGVVFPRDAAGPTRVREHPYRAESGRRDTRTTHRGHADPGTGNLRDAPRRARAARLHGPPAHALARNRSVARKARASRGLSHSGTGSAAQFSRPSRPSPSPPSPTSCSRP